MTEAKSRIDDREKPAAWRTARAAGDFCIYLGLRFWKDHNFSAAASLSYTTLLAVVPLAAIGFSILAAFPVFDRIRTDLLSFILEIFLPQNVEAVRGQFDLFLRNTRELTAVGTVALAVTAVILLDTVDTWFNRIWRQPEVRPLVQRMTMYWAVLTVTPLLAGGSIAISTYLFAQANLGVVEGSWVQNTAVRWLPPLLLFVSFAVAYMVIPYRKVRLGYAALGAVVALLLYDGLKWGFSLYFRAFPSYETLYGALSYIPLLLIWMYLVWCAVLFGAQTAAALPEWLALQRHGAPGESRATRRLGQAMVILHGLYRAGETGRPSNYPKRCWSAPLAGFARVARMPLLGAARSVALYPRVQRGCLDAVARPTAARPFTKSPATSASPSGRDWADYRTRRSGPTGWTP